jgi:hypothetical protein
MLRGADADRLVGEPHVEAVRSASEYTADRLDAELLAGPDDAERDLAAVGDEDLA